MINKIWYDVAWYDFTKNNFVWTPHKSLRRELGLFWCLIYSTNFAINIVEAYTIIFVIKTEPTLLFLPPSSLLRERERERLLGLDNGNDIKLSTQMIFNNKCVCIYLLVVYFDNPENEQNISCYVFYNWICYRNN